MKLICTIGVDGGLLWQVPCIAVLHRRTVAWGNLAGILAFVTETSLVFLMTLYLQQVLGFSPLAAGLSFGVLNLGTVLGGTIAPRIIARTTTTSTLIIGALIQTAATAALLALGTTNAGLTLMLIATFIGGIGNMLLIVGFMVTATSGLPDNEQGMATGLATMSQQIGITMGTPIMSAIATGTMATTAVTGILDGIQTAVAVNAALVLLTALFLRTVPMK